MAMLDDHIRGGLGFAAIAAVTAATLSLVASGRVAAPEPATLNASLWGSGTSQSATYVTSRTQTWAVQWPNTWAAGSVPPGLPCATYNAGYGTTLTTVILAQGNYRKCGGSNSGSSTTPITSPEPAQLTQSLAIANPANAIWVNSKIRTLAFRWPNTWLPNNTIPPGMPCASYVAGYGARLTGVILAQGNYRKCNQ